MENLCFYAKVVDFLLKMWQVLTDHILVMIQECHPPPSPPLAVMGEKHVWLPTPGWWHPACLLSPYKHFLGFFQKLAQLPFLLCKCDQQGVLCKMCFKKNFGGFLKKGRKKHCREIHWTYIQWIKKGAFENNRVEIEFEREALKSALNTIWERNRGINFTSYKISSRCTAISTSMTTILKHGWSLGFFPALSKIWFVVGWYVSPL